MQISRPSICCDVNTLSLSLLHYRSINLSPLGSDDASGAGSIVLYAEPPTFPDNFHLLPTIKGPCRRGSRRRRPSAGATYNRYWNGVAGRVGNAGSVSSASRWRTLSGASRRFFPRISRSAAVTCGIASAGIPSLPNPS